MTQVVDATRSRARRARIVVLMAPLAALSALLLGLESVPDGAIVSWAVTAATVCAASVLAVVLARSGRVDFAAALLLVGISVSMVLGCLITDDLGTAPYWVGALGAGGLLMLSRERMPMLIGGLVVLLVALGLAAGPAHNEIPFVGSLLLDGSIVTLATMLVALVGLRDRLSPQVAAREVSARSDALLLEQQRTRTDLERHAAEHELALEQLQTEREHLRAELADMAVRDPRTGLYNARHHKEQWAVAVEESVSTGLPVSVIAFDLDEFGRINRDYSHDAGDRVLEEFAALIRRLIRPGDVPYRLGQGEEFLVLLPHTRQEEAVHVAERIRLETRRHVWSATSEEERLTVSAGVSSRAADSGELWRGVLLRADGALRRSKEEGRDRVTADGGEGT